VEKLPKAIQRELEMLRFRVEFLEKTDAVVAARASEAAVLDFTRGVLRAITSIKQTREFLSELLDLLDSPICNSHVDSLHTTEQELLALVTAIPARFKRDISNAVFKEELKSVILFKGLKPVRTEELILRTVK
jgi:hypothetical protein